MGAAMSTPTVHVVDDDELVRAALSNLLRAAGYAVQSHGSAAEFLAAVPERSPGCLVVDVLMPGLNGLELQAELVRRESAMPVVIVSAHGDVPMTVSAMKAGAVDFLTKPVDKFKLLSAVKEALSRTADAGDAAEMQSLRNRCESLTPREREIYRRVAAGLLNKQIADELGTSERTVKTHRARLMEKMQARTLADLVHMATLLKLQ
jgi:RNA polymerase sigma factor (sigma-70 family)